MHVRSKKPDYVFWDEFQKIAIYGKKTFEVKPSHFILGLLNKGLIEEVKAEPEVKAEAAKPKKEAMKEKIKETA